MTIETPDDRHAGDIQPSEFRFFFCEACQRVHFRIPLGGGVVFQAEVIMTSDLREMARQASAMADRQEMVEREHEGAGHG